MTRLDTLPGPVRSLVGLALGTVTLLHRIRHPRTLRVGRGVIILGGLKLQQGTTLVLGDRVRVRRGVSVNGGGTVTVGADTLLNGCWIGARTTVTIGAGCLVSDCDITDSDFHNLEPELRHAPAGPRTQAPVTIGDNVWVGFKSIVLKGTTIGDDSAVGAGSVVRGTVPARVVVTGNPAAVVKEL